MTNNAMIHITARRLILEREDDLYMDRIRRDKKMKAHAWKILIPIAIVAVIAALKL